jgi:hypothetical protein
MKDKSNRQLTWEEKHMKLTIAMYESVEYLAKIRKEKKFKQKDITSFVGCDGKVVYNEPTEIFYSERFKQQEQ